jgi:AraC family transcriptional regulator, melibiose operon regulatory protein
MEPYLEKKLIIPGQVVYPFSCFITDSKAVRPYVSPHFHSYIEILYILQGTMKIQFGNESCDIFEGSLALIDSREVHSTYIDTSFYNSCIVLKFEPEIFSYIGTFFEIQYILPFISSNFKHKKIFNKIELEGTGIPDALNDILKEFQNKEYGFELAVNSGIYKIFLWLLRNSYSDELKSELARLSKTINKDKLQSVLKYVEQNYTEDISITLMAKMCNSSYSYFSRQFSKIMGKTFKEYLNFIRIDEAEKLLLTTDMNITKISLAVGFSNTSYFIKQFKRYKIISPKQYKQNVLLTK